LDKKRRKALETAGWKTSDTPQELLGLSDEDMVIVEMKVALSEAVKTLRERKKVTQAKLAKLMGTGQPRIALLEDGNASIETMIRALLVLGSTPKQISSKMAVKSKRKAA